MRSSHSPWRQKCEGCRALLVLRIASGRGERPCIRRCRRGSPQGCRTARLPPGCFAPFRSRDWSTPRGGREQARRRTNPSSIVSPSFLLHLRTEDRGNIVGKHHVVARPSLGLMEWSYSLDHSCRPCAWRVGWLPALQRRQKRKLV